MQYTAFAVAIVLSQSFTRRKGFVIFAGIGNLNHFFQFRPLLHYYCCRYLIRIIYTYVVVYYRREAEL